MHALHECDHILRFKFDVENLERIVEEGRKPLGMMDKVKSLFDLGINDDEEMFNRKVSVCYFSYWLCFYRGSIKMEIKTLIIFNYSLCINYTYKIHTYLIVVQKRLKFLDKLTIYYKKLLIILIKIKYKMFNKML